MATKKARSAFVCGECGSEHAKWQGQCNACEAWNTLSRVNIGPIAEPVRGFAGAASEVKRLADVKAEEVERIATGLGELDRVLGGGLVPGSMILIGGDPGAGKSTLLLQVATMLARTHKVLYVTGEESLTQLAMRAHRLRLPVDELVVAAETIAETIAAEIEQRRPDLVILDSIQVMQLSSVD